MADTVHFSTLLRPHRSLSPLGFKWLIRGAIAANLLIGVPMFLLGAWPVLGFMGLDIWLLYWMFQRSYQDARRSETLTLTDHELIVDRIAPDGEREQHHRQADQQVGRNGAADQPLEAFRRQAAMGHERGGEVNRRG